MATTNIIDKWKKSMDINEQTEKSIRELKTVNIRNKELLDQNMELLNESKMELKYTQLKILQRLEEQQAVIKKLEVQEQPEQPDNAQEEILRRLDNQDRVLHRLDNIDFHPVIQMEQPEADEDQESGLKELLELQEEIQHEMRHLLKGMDDVTSNLTTLQRSVLEEQEAERKREYRVVRSYFKAVLWILLILVVLFGAYIWGFIGGTPLYG